MNDLRKKWTELIENISNLSILVPRHVMIKPTYGIELHGFADGSFQAYAAVVYVKVVGNGFTHTALWTAKTKVAPMKNLTIPRIELLACVLLAKLMEKLTHTIECETKVHRKFCWNDSIIAYHWINQPQKEWKQWVKTRVCKICSILPGQQWYHVPGQMNPADLVVRTTILEVF